VYIKILRPENIKACHMTGPSAVYSTTQTLRHPRKIFPRCYTTKIYVDISSVNQRS